MAGAGQPLCCPRFRLLSGPARVRHEKARSWPTAAVASAVISGASTPTRQGMPADYRSVEVAGYASRGLDRSSNTANGKPFRRRQGLRGAQKEFSTAACCFCATISSYFTKATVQDGFSVLLSPRDNSYGRMSISVLDSRPAAGARSSLRSRPLCAAR